MDKKTSFVLYPADFLAAVHNFKKSQIADLIIALCEKIFTEMFLLNYQTL